MGLFDTLVAFFSKPASETDLKKSDKGHICPRCGSIDPQHHAS